MRHTWLFLLLCISSFACEEGIKEFIACKKTYVYADQLNFENNIILVSLHDDHVIETAAVYSDGLGFYFKDYKQQKCDKGQWKCRICDHCNPNFKIWCEVCSN